MGRFVKPVPVGAAELAAADPDRDTFLARVAKYVPSEVVAAYVFLNGVIVAAAAGQGLLPGDPFLWHAGAFVVSWVATPAYLWQAAPPGQPRMLQVTLSTIAFPIWAYAIGGGVFSAVLYPAVGSILLAVFSLISGLFKPRVGDR
jgi:hypothetical protein